MIRSKPNLLTEVRVLVVEDEFLLARDLAHALRAKGAEVIGPVATAEAAVRAIDTEAPDCAVLDMNLRGLPSGDVVTRLDRDGIDYIVVSGYDRRALPDAIRSRPYLEKPTTPGAITAALERLMLR